MVMKKAVVSQAALTGKFHVGQVGLFLSSLAEVDLGYAHCFDRHNLSFGSITVVKLSKVTVDSEGAD